MNYLKVCATINTICMVTATVAIALLLWQIWPKPPQPPRPEPPHMKVLLRDANGKLIVHDPGGYDPRTIGLGSGLCVYDGIREKVAPGSRGRELTAEEEKRFIEATERIGVGTTFVRPQSSE